MKTKMKYIIAGLLISILVGNNSCTDILNIEPENAVTYGNSFQTESDFVGTINSINGEIRNWVSGNDNPHYYMGEITDSYQRVFNAGSFSQIAWTSYYDVIYLSNMILENTFRAEGKISNDRINYYIGQAYFYRSLAYYYLARDFGDAIITTGTQSTAPYGKSSALDVLNYAIESAEMANPLLYNYGQAKDENGNIIVKKSYGTKGSNSALLANIYAWKASMSEIYNWSNVDILDSYKKSISWCDSVIASSSYTLESNVENLISKEFTSMLDRSNLTESIFEVPQYFSSKYTADVSPFYFPWFTFPYNIGAGQSAGTIATSTSYKLKQSTVDSMYGKSDGSFDDRRGSYFFWGDDNTQMPSDNISGGFAYPAKWRSGLYRPSGTRFFAISTDVNFIVFRLSSIYLLRAENYNSIGQTGLAISDLNKVRERCNADLYPASGETDLKRSIFNEETKEELWEGTRYYNVVRNKYYKTDLDFNQEYGHTYFSEISDIDVKNGALYYPVNSSAFINNDLMRQNVYWAEQGVPSY